MQRIEAHAAIGAVEGGVLGIVVKKMFTGVPGISPAELDIAVAAVTAAPNVAPVAIV